MRRIPDSEGTKGSTMGSEGDAHRLMELKDGAAQPFASWGVTLAAALPSALGLGLARAGVVVGNYGSYAQSDNGILSDGTALVASVVLLLILLLIVMRHSTVTKRVVNRLFRLTVGAQTISLGALAALDLAVPEWFPAIFLVSCFNALASPCAMFYWIRRMRDASSSSCMGFVFMGLVVSETVVFALLGLSGAGRLGAMALLVLLQLPLARMARLAESRLSRVSSGGEPYLGYGSGGNLQKRVMIISGASVGTLALVLGLLRGYPTGLPIEFTPITRALCFMLVCGLGSAAVFAAYRARHDGFLVAAIWTCLQVLAFLAIGSFALFPESLEWGALFVTALNALFVMFSLYATLAFINAGWRDPYYYCIGGWVALFVPRAVARMVTMHAPILGGNIVLIGVVASFLVAISVEIMLLMLAWTYWNDAKRRGERESFGTLQRIMGLDEPVANLSDVRAATMRKHAEEMGERFGLTPREVDVLALYALGFTQKRVADELFISQSTAHEYVKRIYVKTDLHSRQDIIDYMSGDE